MVNDAGLVGHIHLNEVCIVQCVGMFSLYLHLQSCYYFLVWDNKSFIEQELLRELNVGVEEIRQKCQETVNSFRRKRIGKKKFNIGYLFKNTVLFARSFFSLSDWIIFMFTNCLVDLVIYVFLFA